MAQKTGSVSEKLRNISTRTLMIIFGGLLVFLITVFSILYIYVDRESTQTITEVGEHYISTLSYQISIHFETIIDLRFKQVQQLASEFQMSQNDYELEQRIYEEAGKGDFSSMAFYTEEMTFIDLYGEQFSPYKLSSFEELVPKGELDISSGYEADGNKVIVLSAPCSLNYQGQPVISLVCTIPVSYFRESLKLENGEGQPNSYFIRSDGTFVIRSSSDFTQEDDATTFYDLFLNSQDQAEISALQEAIENKESYSAILYTDSWYHLYESPLPHSNWYLITMVPFGTVDAEISRMEWILASGSALTILAIVTAIAVIFLYGSRVIRAQRHAMEKERKRLERVARRDQSYNQMAMDLQLPVQAVLDESQSIQDNLNNPSYTRSHLETIRKTAAFMLNQLRQSVRLGSANSLITYQERIYFPEIIHEAIEMISPLLTLKKQSLSFENEASGLQYGYADPERLKQIFIDAISTASSFTNPDESVHVLLRERSHTDHLIELSLVVYAPRLPRQKEDETRWFYNLENLERIMTMMDGSLEMGTARFTLNFSMEASPSDIQYPKMEGTILLLDPDEKVLNAEAMSLEKMGFEVIRCSEPDPAMQIVLEGKVQLIMCEALYANLMEQFLHEHVLQVPLLVFSLHPDLPSMISQPFFSEQLDQVLRRYFSIR